MTKGIGGVHDNPNLVECCVVGILSGELLQPGGKNKLQKKHPQFGQGKHSSSYKEEQIFKYMTVPNVIDICYVT